MSTHRINCLLLNIFLKGDVICYEQLYNNKKYFLNDYIRRVYKKVKDKTLYSLSDFSQEIWLNIWLYTNKERIEIHSEDEFNRFLIGVVYDTLIQINDKELAI